MRQFSPTTSRSGEQKSCGSGKAVTCGSTDSAFTNSKGCWWFRLLKTASESRWGWFTYMLRMPICHKNKQRIAESAVLSVMGFEPDCCKRRNCSLDYYTINICHLCPYFFLQVQTLTGRCWDVCFSDYRPPSKMDGKTRNCINNCVNRMIDASNFMVEHLQKTGGEMT